MTEQANNWKKYDAKDIPSSMGLFSLFYTYVKRDFAILDLGCGYGKTVLRLYAEGFSHVYGADLNANGIRFAQERADSLGYRDLSSQFVVADAMHLPYPDASFDCVITQAFWTSILPHERRPIVEEIKRILRKDGILYMAIWIQNWHLPSYQERYKEGRAKGLEEGSFEVKDPLTGEVKYIAHHYTIQQVQDLLASVGFATKEHLPQSATTQTGTLINCLVVIASL